MLSLLIISIKIHTFVIAKTFAIILVPKLQKNNHFERPVTFPDKCISWDLKGISLVTKFTVNTILDRAS